MRRALSVTLTLGAVAVVAGCSSGRPASPGRAVFAQFCAQCHTVTGHDTNASGGDLRIARLSVASAASFTRMMPIHPRLDRQQTQAVARFVVGGNG